MTNETSAVPIADDSASLASQTVPADAVSADVDTPVLRRRSRTQRRFLPTESREKEVVVNRSFVGQRKPGQKSELSRERVIAGDLPGWEPLPPHELLVQRPR